MMTMMARTNTTTPAAAPLTEAERGAALEFLDRRPVHNVIMSGWMLEHGVVSPSHRGTFYRTLDARGRINGVALIGRHTLFEAASDGAVSSFADEARRHSDVKMLFGESGRLADFWRRFSTGRPARGDSRSQLLFERREAPATDPDLAVRPAGKAQLDQIVAAHACMVRDETGADPILEDAEGFRSRCLQRIEAGKTWSATSPEGELMFKADVVSRTPKAVYIEGVWVDPRFRGRNVAKECLDSLCGILLDGTNAICGFVDSSDHRALSLYRRAGFEPKQKYRKIYV